MRLISLKEDGTPTLTKDLTADELCDYPYAILSHTWLPDNEDEITFQELTSGVAETKPDGFAKIKFCGEQAARNDLKYFWIDTCCINKDLTSELQEAIKLMYSWYQGSSRCYVYLTDVSVDGPDALSSPELWHSQFRSSRWFTRGWTLQELLAPKSVEFFSKEGTRLGNKTSLLQMIHEITNIPVGALQGDDLEGFPVDQRLSWSANRQTKRREDKAYCLFGIFNIAIPPTYGVEEDGAFARLKEEIFKHTNPDYLLKQLPTAEAAFDSIRNRHAPICLPKTRGDILSRMYAWVEDQKAKPIFWLRGLAGAGKSTVARTIADKYSSRGELGGSFFFMKGDKELGHSKMFVTTLARQLAYRVPQAQPHICRVLKRQADIAWLPLRDQWEQLIIGPLSKIETTPSHPATTIVFVVDALDECGGENNVGAIIRAIGTARVLTSVRLRIFITSRPGISIDNVFRDLTGAQRDNFIRYEDSYDSVNPDLRLLFENKLAEIVKSRCFDEDWPGSQCIDRLVDCSGRLFILAATACRFIAEGKTHDTIQKRLNRLVKKTPSDTDPEKQLDDIYTTVLRDFSEEQINKSDDDSEDLLEMLQEILGTIVILQAPLTVRSLARLIDRPLDKVEHALNNLQTILNISQEEPRYVHLHHSTLRDFLFDNSRCIDKKFHVNEKKAHGLLGSRCLRVMNEKLRFNICNLGSLGTQVESLEKEHIEQHIPGELQYACLHWTDHYRQSVIRLQDGDETSIFFKKHFLHWLEVINIIGKSAEMGAIIRSYHSLLMV